MGCDGGTIPKRKEIVKNKDRRPRREERDKKASAAERWKLCALSDWTLRRPIVAGHYGHLFCKEEMIQHLLDYKRGCLLAYDMVVQKAPVLDSFHSMKDIKELKFKDNPLNEAGESLASDDDSIRADFVCPITGLETNGKYKFFFSWNCGCVVSERAIKEVPNDEKCLVCQTPYKPWDLVQLNPEGRKELEENQAKMMCRKMRPFVEADMLETGVSSQSSSSLSQRAGPSSSGTSGRTKDKQARPRRRREEGDTDDGAGPSASTSSG